MVAGAAISGHVDHHCLILLPEIDCGKASSFYIGKAKQIKIAKKDWIQPDGFTFVKLLERESLSSDETRQESSTVDLVYL